MVRSIKLCIPQPFGGKTKQRWMTLPRQCEICFTFIEYTRRAVVVCSGIQRGIACACYALVTIDGRSIIDTV